MPENQDTPERLPPFVVRDGDGYRFSWARALALCGAMFLGAIGGSFLLELALTGRFRTPPLASFGMAGCMCCTMLAMGIRKQRDVAAGNLKSKWGRFGLLEFLVFAIGFSLLIAFATADRNASLAEQRAVETLQSAAEQQLGPDGTVHRNSEGIHITVCDRAFDDQRLAELTSLAEAIGVLDNVTSLHLASSTTNFGTPEVWPGLTDASVDVLLRWRAIERLWIAGATITPDGAERLTESPGLRDAWFTSAFDPAAKARIETARPNLGVRAGGQSFGHD